MKKFMFAVSVCLCLMILSSAIPQLPQVQAAATEPYGLNSMAQFDRLPYLKLDTLAGHSSSFDRTGGNNDGFGASNYLYTQPNGEKVMLDLKGPGSVYRMWFTGFDNNTAYIKVYFNGEAAPRINMLLKDIFAGNNAPFLAPLAVNYDGSSGGFVSYVPLPFTSSIKIVTNGTGADFFYNIGYHMYSPNTAITTYTGSEDSTVVRDMWNKVGTDPKSQTGNVPVSGTFNIPAGGVVDLLNIAGPKSISSIKVKIPDIVGGPVFTQQDDGKAFTGSSQFKMAVDPGNQGVILQRRMDYTIANQKARVLVDGVYVGDWYNAGSAINQWRNFKFYIPKSFTAGKSSINIRIEFISSALDWNEFYYWAFSITGSGEVVSDELNVGNAASESAHLYSNTGGWSGTKTFNYPGDRPDTQDILNNTWIRIYWDNEATPSVYAPIGSFFGMGEFGSYDVAALPIGLDEYDNMYIYYPMPFATNAKVQIVNNRAVATNNISYEIKHKPFNDSFADVGYFKTSFIEAKPTTAGKDATILSQTGSGHLVGVVQSMRGVLSRRYLEGDERVQIDDSKSPGIHGTGTEDFFDAGWYFGRGTFTNPVSGNPKHIADASYDYTSAYRLFLEAIPFRKQIKASIEHGPVNDEVAIYWILAYYYMKPNLRAVLTDTLDVSNTASESNHTYSINSQTWSGSRTFTYEGDLDTVNITDDGRAFAGTGYSQFNMAIQPTNQGVLLRRRFDQTIANQQAQVYVDGALAGTWYRAGDNTYHQWRDDDFMIPASYTSGKTTIQIKVQFVSSSGDWNEFTYWAYTLTP